MNFFVRFSRMVIIVKILSWLFKTIFGTKNMFLFHHEIHRTEVFTDNLTDNLRWGGRTRKISNANNVQVVKWGDRKRKYFVYCWDKNVQKEWRIEAEFCVRMKSVDCVWVYWNSFHERNIRGKNPKASEITLLGSYMLKQPGVCRVYAGGSKRLK